MITYKIYPREAKKSEKTGLAPFYVQVIENGQPHQKKLEDVPDIDIKHYDKKKNNRAKPAAQNYSGINSLLTDYKSRADNIIHEFAIPDKYIARFSLMCSVRKNAILRMSIEGS